VTNRLEPPGGDPPPLVGRLGESETLDLYALAREVCRRYRLEFPDEVERYGDVGNAWCVHDNQYLLDWAAEATSDNVDMRDEVAWLASVLEARHFPLDRLARNLDIGADVVLDEVTGSPGARMAAVLADAAEFVRSRDTFLDRASPLG
jgi:hypothetical protein